MEKNWSDDSQSELWIQQPKSRDYQRLVWLDRNFRISFLFDQKIGWRTRSEKAKGRVVAKNIRPIRKKKLTTAAAAHTHPHTHTHSEETKWRVASATNESKRSTERPRRRSQTEDLLRFSFFSGLCDFWATCPKQQDRRKWGDTRSDANHHHHLRHQHSFHSRQSQIQLFAWAVQSMKKKTRMTLSSRFSYQKEISFVNFLDHVLAKGWQMVWMSR